MLFAAITAAQRQAMDSISRLTTSWEILSHSIFKELNNSALVVCLCFRTWHSSSSHKSSMRFKSGDRDGEFKTLTSSEDSHPLTTFDVCFESLSCWNTQFCGIFLLAYGSKFLFSAFGPTPWVEKTPHTITFPPPCFTVGIWYLT